MKHQTTFGQYTLGTDLYGLEQNYRLITLLIIGTTQIGTKKGIVKQH